MGNGHNCIRTTLLAEQVWLEDMKLHGAERKETALCYSLGDYSMRQIAVCRLGDAGPMVNDQEHTFTSGELEAYSIYSLAGKLSVAGLGEGQGVIAYESLKTLEVAGLDDVLRLRAEQHLADLDSRLMTDARV